MVHSVVIDIRIVWEGGEEGASSVMTSSGCCMRMVVALVLRKHCDTSIVSDMVEADEPSSLVSNELSLFKSLCNPP